MRARLDISYDPAEDGPIVGGVSNKFLVGDAVMAADLVAVVHTLRQVVCVKG